MPSLASIQRWTARGFGSQSLAACRCDAAEICYTEQTNASVGVSLSLLAEAHQAALEMKRDTLGQNVMYFETGQRRSLSANAHRGVDQQTCEARAYAVARKFKPLLVNSVVGFIGPEYLYDGKQIYPGGLGRSFLRQTAGLTDGCGRVLYQPCGSRSG